MRSGVGESIPRFYTTHESKELKKSKPTKTKSVGLVNQLYNSFFMVLIFLHPQIYCDTHTLQKEVLITLYY